MPDTTSAPVAPSAPIAALLSAVSTKPSAAEGMRAMMQRKTEFPSLLAAKLTGIALHPTGRLVADEALDAYWAAQTFQRDPLGAAGPAREVIIGSGFHAAVYAAVRVRSGHPKPLVLERGPRAGGSFAMTARPTFTLNSRNRAGGAGLAGDQGASLNFLPGAVIQAANVSMVEYPPNTDMALVIRLALAQFADVVTGATVVSVATAGAGVMVELADRDPVVAGRVIDARGVGDPIDADSANGTTILTFDQFMARMAGVWPLRGIRRAAVVGGGDSAKCVVESLLGIAPQPFMAAAALDTVERVDWFAENLPSTCQEWQVRVRGRYQALGRYLRPDRLGVRRLTVLQRRAQPLALPGTALIDGRTYDLAVVCTGNRETVIDGLEARDCVRHPAPDGTYVARRYVNLPGFRVGPHANLPFTDQEREDGVTAIAANAVSMFRTATKTAALAATLPPLPGV